MEGEPISHHVALLRKMSEHCKCEERDSEYICNH